MGFNCAWFMRDVQSQRQHQVLLGTFNRDSLDDFHPLASPAADVSPQAKAHLITVPGLVGLVHSSLAQAAHQPPLFQPACCWGSAFSERGRGTLRRNWWRLSIAYSP